MPLIAPPNFQAVEHIDAASPGYCPFQVEDPDLQIAISRPSSTTESAGNRK